MAGYAHPQRSNPYSFLGSRPSTRPTPDSNSGTRPVSSYFRDGNGDSYLMTVETTIQRVPPSSVPAGSYEVGLDQVQMSSGPTHDMPPIVEELLKKIQYEVSQPAWPPAASQFPSRFPRPAPAGQFGAASQSTFGFSRPSPAVQFGPTTQIDFGEFTNVMPRPITEPGFIGHGHQMVTPRTAPAPPRVNAKISQAMNDLSAATEYPKELTRPPALNTDRVTGPQNPVPLPAAVNKDSAPVTIDSREAARRYKNMIVSTEPYRKEGSAPLLDSNAAKEKYRGMFV